MDKIHRIKCGNVNCHIVENGTSGILVDTGKKEYIDKVRAACRPYDIRLIVLTHGHFDHAENAARLSEALDAPIGMAAGDRDLIASNGAQELFAETFLGKIVLAAPSGIFPPAPCPPFCRMCCCTRAIFSPTTGSTRGSSHCRGTRPVRSASTWAENICSWATR